MMWIPVQYPANVTEILNDRPSTHSDPNHLWYLESFSRSDRFRQIGICSLEELSVVFAQFLSASNSIMIDIFVDSLFVEQ